MALRFLDDGISTEGTMGKMVVTICPLWPKLNANVSLNEPMRGALEAKAKGVKFWP